MTNSPGPTSAGSINARLTLDADQFERDITRAQEQADRLDGRDITVHVRADNANTAATELEHAEAATSRLESADSNLSGEMGRGAAVTRQRTEDVRNQTRATGDAESALARAEVAANRYRIAELNLEDVMSRGNATEQERLRAQNALTTAGVNLDRAVAQRAAHVREETAAEQAAAAAEDATTAATDRNTASRKANNDANKDGFPWLQAFIALSPLALAGADSLAAGAVGMATDFSIMAAAGAAAVAGIKKEMQDGTVTGQTYAAGLQTLKTDLDQLEQTSAQSFLSGFSTGVDDINRAMPVLNQLIGTGAQELGSMANSLVGGLLTGLEQMNPLIQAGGDALGQFVSWLAQMTASDGFTQFVAYAVANMPGVLNLLESLVTLAGSLLAAFAPLGPAVVTSLGAIADILSSLPLPVLAGLTTMIVALPASFALAKAAVATFGETAALQALNVEIFGTAINLAVPVVGVLTAGLAALTIGIAASSGATEQAIPSANAYADALERDGNAIGDNTTKMAEHNLAQAGAYDAVGKLGLGYDALTQAVTGNKDALHIVQDAINQANDKYNTAAANAKVSGLKISQSILDQKAAADLLGPALNNNLQAILQQQHANQQYASASQDATQATKDKAAQDAIEAARLGITTEQYQQANKAQDDAAQKTRDTTAAMQVQNDAAGLLKQAWDELNGKTISAAQAQNKFDSDLANMGTHVDKVGKQIQFTTTSINDQSAASVALRGQLIGQVNDIEAVIEKNGDLQGATAQSRQQYVDMRQRIIDNAVAHGVNRDAVTKYIDTLFQIPPVVQTKAEADTAAAQMEIARLKAAIDSIHDKSITITANYTGVGGGPAGAGQGGNAPGTSGGGLVHAYAQGGWAGSGYAYRALGGGMHPAARGTDTLPTMLTKDEFVVNRAASTMLERDTPGALDYINRHGQLPTAQGGGGPVYLTAYVVNPFTGEQVRATVAAVADQRIGAAARDAAALRPGLG